MKSPETGEENESRFRRLQILAALKSGRGEEKGFHDAFFMDNEHWLEDQEIMQTVAKTYPYVIGHLSKLNENEDFVRRWFSYIEDPEVRRKVYNNARANKLRINIEGL